MKRFFFLLSLISLSFCSCRDEYTICNESKYSILNGTFLKRTAAGDSAITVPSLTVQNLSNNNYIYNQVANVGTFNVPLSVAMDTAIFSIKNSSSSPTDTITIKYTNAQEYLSLECGSIDVFTITSIKFTKHSLDTIKLVDPAVRNRNENNLKIYF